MLVSFIMAPADFEYPEDWQEHPLKVICREMTERLIVLSRRSRRIEISILVAAVAVVALWCSQDPF
jgi:hypothetical protein